MDAGSSHFALGVVCAGHSRVGDDFLPFAVLVEPMGGCAKDRGYQKLWSSTWSPCREFCAESPRPILRRQQVFPHKPCVDRPTSTRPCVRK